MVQELIKQLKVLNEKSHLVALTMHDFLIEMCTHVYISVTKWCIVG